MGLNNVEAEIENRFAARLTNEVLLAGIKKNSILFVIKINIIFLTSVIYMLE